MARVEAGECVEAPEKRRKLNALYDSLDSAARFFGQHPAMLGSLMYLLITCVGITYSFFLYQNFGINVFDFAETNDLLLAAFKDFNAFLISMLAVVSSIFLFALLLMLRPKGSAIDDGSPTSSSAGKAILSTVVMFIVIFGIAFVVAYLFSKAEARSVKQNLEDPVNVTYRLTAAGSAEPTTETDVELIGATQKAAFFYDPDDGHTLAIPHAQIVSIEFP